MGQAQGTQAVQRQAELEHSASHKAVFLPRMRKKKTKTKCRKDSQERKSRKGTSGNLLAQHSVTCGDVKGIQTVSPEAVDPPHPSLSPFLPKNEKVCETHSWMYYRR